MFHFRIFYALQVTEVFFSYIYIKIQIVLSGVYFLPASHDFM